MPGMSFFHRVAELTHIGVEAQTSPWNRTTAPCRDNLVEVVQASD